MLEETTLSGLLNEVAKRCPNGALPKSYLVLDIETSGFGARNVGLEYGFCQVVDSDSLLTFSQILNRGDTPINPQAFDVHQIDKGRMEREGVYPSEFIKAYSALLYETRKKSFMFMGHNLAAFDVPIIERETAEFDVPFIFNENEIIDTGMLVKASQLGMTFRPDESLRSFYLRTASVRSRVKWSLNEYCYDQYGLSKYGCEREGVHRAGFGCVLGHYLFRAMREKAQSEGIACKD